MRKRRLFWRILASYVVLIAASLAATFFFAWPAMDRFVQSNHIDDIDRAARYGGQAVPLSGDLTVTEATERFCQEIADGSGMRVTLVARNGSVLFDSLADAATMDNHGDRLEIREAFETGRGFSIRRSFTIGTSAVYVAYPIDYEGETVAVFRASRTDAEMREGLNKLRQQFFLIISIVGIIAFLGAAVIARNYAYPIEVMRKTVESFGKKRLSKRVSTNHTGELSELGEALNSMASNLDSHIQNLESQRNELDAILGSMQEGVLAIDREEKIISLNTSAEQMLGISESKYRNRLVQEALRHVELQRYVKACLSDDPQQSPEGTIIEMPDGPQLRAMNAPLEDNGGNRIGTLIILADITRLLQLENLRREFVANVSHELKTPITSITGFAETLLDGALEDPNGAEKFVSIIHRQAGRLTDVIEDLLSLSRLDRADLISKSPCVVRDIIDQALEVCCSSEDKGCIEIELDCDESIEIPMNPVLMGQALSNLLHNAIRYGGSGGKIVVEVQEEGGFVTIAIEDSGPGIEPEHLDRLFERFYRVDKARSSELGGTGLGLSIVKHVAQAHGGEVSVESEVGRGSRFSMIIPAT